MRIGPFASTVVIVALLSKATCIGAQQSDWESIPLTVAQRFMEAAFPDLKPSAARVFATVASSFSGEWVRSGLVIVSVNPRATDTEPFLDANIDVLSGTIHRADFSGRRVNTRRAELLQREAETHPAWTDDDMANALQRAGAKFSYKDQVAFEEALHLERFAAMFGTLKAFKSSFRWRVQQQVLGPAWFVEAAFVDHAGQTICYSFTFDAFDGALRSAGRNDAGRDCRP